MKVSVIRFPGSNCDIDAVRALKTIANTTSDILWHQENTLPKGTDLVILPGGFSFGDYLRSGAIAANSPIMAAVKKFADTGGYILGICNGFQILTETHILSGALICNHSTRFICRNVFVQISTKNTAFTKQYGGQDAAIFPVAHHDGQYVVDEETHQRLIDNDRIVFRYADARGNAGSNDNINGSIDNIAGIVSENRRILGMMPHPERATGIAGKTTLYDGSAMFQSLVDNI